MEESEGPAEEFLDLEPDLAPGMEPEEGTPAHRRVKRSALAQGAEIPQGWKPTLREPIPVVRCHHIFRDTHPRAGERCGRWSLRGTLKCFRHSGNGNLKNVEEYRRAIIESARLELTGAVPDALATLIDLSQNSGADNVKLKAATEILDRSGIRGGTELDVQVNDVTGTDPAHTLAERLGKLRVAAEQVKAAQDRAREARELEAGEEAVPLPVIDTSADVIEGEIVADSAADEEESAP